VCHLYYLSTNSSTWSSNFIVQNDIDLSGVTYLPVIDDFTGTFDGNGKKILNWTSDNGFFVRSTGVIKNLTLVNAQINYSGISRIGALVSTNDVGGQVINCSVSGAVTATVSATTFVGALVAVNNGTITLSQSNSSVSGKSAVGGLVGYNSGVISKSSSIGQVVATASGSGMGAGGLVGTNMGTLSDVYSKAAVQGASQVGGLIGLNKSTLSNGFSSGSVTGSATLIGGLVGDNTGGSVSLSFWDTQSSGQVTSAAGSGKTTAQMFDATTYAGWNFASLWNSPSADYPSLK
jgi:hypothetical protein